MMGPNKYQLILIAVIAVLWLGVGNLIVYDVLRKKGLSRIHLLNPFICFKFDAKDWGKIFLLIIILVGLVYLTIVLGAK
jgi:hypothetical protein